MKLTWQRSVDTCRGFAEGVELVQVPHVFGPGGTDRGWLVWLVQEQGELFDRYPTSDEAMTAAEAWLDALTQPSAGEAG